MSVDATAEASDLARRLIAGESRGHGDTEGALHRIEQRYGLGKWQLSHLKSGKAKSCDVGLFVRLRGAYLDMCQRQVRRLRHELEIEEAKGGGDDVLEDLLAEAAELDAKIHARRSQLKRGGE